LPNQNGLDRVACVVDFSTHDSEFGLVLATRSVLRVLPLLNTDDRIGDRAKSQFVLAVFHALAVAWARIQFPELVHRNDGVAAARNIGSFEPSARTTAQRIGNAAREAAFCAGARSSRTADSRARVARLRATQAIELLNNPVLLRSVIAQADAYDEGDISPGVTAAQLSAIALWPGGQPPGFIEDTWKQLRDNLLFANEGWEVWIEWYEARLRGEVRSQTVELAYVNYAKRVSPTAIAWEANSLIATLLADGRPESESGLPGLEPGPVLEVGERGLTLLLPAPAVESDDAIQVALHVRLKALADDLVSATRRVGNVHPGLLSVVTEYAELVSEPMESLDITALWAVGAGLLANLDAFSRMPSSEVMTEPLEPSHLALLQQVGQLHGAFILGFSHGRELTERADHSRLTPEVLSTILPPAKSLLGHWRHQQHWVEARTRNFFAALQEGAISPSWQVTRAGYAVYAVARNALIAIGRAVTMGHRALSTFVGGAAGTLVLSQVDPGYAQTQHLVQFLLDQSQTILSFSDPFPDLKIWLASLIDELEQDRTFRQR
jgi:hypothetical protein